MANSIWKYSDRDATERLEMLRNGNKELYDEEMARTKQVIKARLDAGFDIDAQLRWADEVGYNYNLNNAKNMGISSENVSKTGYGDKLLAKIEGSNKSSIAPSIAETQVPRGLTDSQIMGEMLLSTQKAADSRKNAEQQRYDSYQKQLDAQYEQYKNQAKRSMEEKLPFLKEALVNAGSHLHGGNSITEQLRLKEQLNNILAQYDIQKASDLSKAHQSLVDGLSKIDSELAQSISDKLYQYNTLLNQKNALEYQKQRDALEDEKWSRELELREKELENSYLRWAAEQEAENNRYERDYELRQQSIADDKAKWQAQLAAERQENERKDSESKCATYIELIKGFQGQSNFDFEKGTYVRKYTDEQLRAWLDTLPLSSYEKEKIARECGL